MSGVATREETVLAFDVLKTSDPAFSVDMNQRIVAWNDAAEQVLGYPANLVIGTPCASVLNLHQTIGNHICRDHCAAVHNARRGRPTRTFEMQATTRQGELKWLSMSTVIAHSASGQKRVVHFFRDVTAQHRVDERLSRAVARVQASSGEPAAQPLQVAQRGELLALQPLTARELDTLRLLARGLPTNEIAATLGISRITARNHVTKLKEKLGVATRLQAVVVASQLGLV